MDGFMTEEQLNDGRKKIEKSVREIFEGRGVRTIDFRPVDTDLWIDLTFAVHNHTDPFCSYDVEKIKHSARTNRHAFKYYSTGVSHEHFDSNQYGVITTFYYKVTIHLVPWYYNELDIQFEYMEGTLLERMEGFVRHIREMLRDAKLDEIGIPYSVIGQFTKDEKERSVFKNLLIEIFKNATTDMIIQVEDEKNGA